MSELVGFLAGLLSVFEGDSIAAGLWRAFAIAWVLLALLGLVASYETPAHRRRPRRGTRPVRFVPESSRGRSGAEPVLGSVASYPGPPGGGR